MFKRLQQINERPALWSVYTSDRMWTDEHISRMMLVFHLNKDTDPASRRASFIARSVRWLIERFDIGPRTSVCDFGCGPGLYTTPLARRGAAVTGVDFSTRSLAHARAVAAREGLDIRYLEGDYLRLDVPGTFDLVTLIYCDLCALSPTQRGVLLRRLRRALAPGGAVVLDVFSLAAYAERKEVAGYGRRLLDGFLTESDYYGFLNTFKYEAEKVVLDKYTVIEPTREWQLYNWLQYYTVDALARELREAGLELVDVLADVAGSPAAEDAPEIAIVARARDVI